MKSLSRLLFLFTCHWAFSAHAITFDEMTADELRAIPPWCQHTQTFDRHPTAPNLYDSYVSRYGEGWTHVHHYCWALGSILRYSRFDQSLQSKQNLARSALDDIDYVLQRIGDDFVLRYEIMLRKARLLSMIGEANIAFQFSQQIISTWPDRADSYGVAAEILSILNRKDEATKLLVEAETRVKDKQRLEQIRAVLKL